MSFSLERVFAFFALIALTLSVAHAGPFKGPSIRDFVRDIARDSGRSESQVRELAIERLLKSRQFDDWIIKKFHTNDAGQLGTWRAMRYLIKNSKFRESLGYSRSIKNADIERVMKRRMDELEEPAVTTPRKLAKAFPAVEAGWTELGRFGKFTKDEHFNEMSAALDAYDGRAQLLFRVWENGGITSADVMFVPIRMTPSEVKAFKEMASGIVSRLEKASERFGEIELDWGPHTTIEGEARPVLRVELQPGSWSHQAFFRKLVRALTKN